MNKSENINSALARQGRVWTLGHRFLAVSCTLECPAHPLPQNSGHSSLLHYHEGYTGALVVLDVPISSYNSLRTTVLVCCGGAQPFYSSGELSDLSPEPKESPGVSGLCDYTRCKILGTDSRSRVLQTTSCFLISSTLGFLRNYSLEVVSVPLCPLLLQP